MLTIAVIGLTRCVWKLAVTASRRVVYGRASLSARGANGPPCPSRMPQTNKSRNAAAGESPGAGAPAEDANPVTREGDLAVGDDNVGDREIIKSPSDPKQYR